MMEFHKQTSIGIMGVSENGRDTIEKNVIFCTAG